MSEQPPATTDLEQEGTPEASPRARVRSAAIVAVLCIAGGLCGCESAGVPLAGEPSSDVRPGDFLEAGSPSDAAVAPGTDPGSDSDSEASKDAASDPTPAVALANLDEAANLPEPVVILDAPVTQSQAMPELTAPVLAAASRGPVFVDGMVGQINGQAIFADDILGELEEQLATLGQREPKDVFRRRAREQIDGLIRERLINALILGEAERALSENEWNGVRYMRSKKREELLRMHGQGSLARTEKYLRDVDGRGLDETLDEYQNGLITNAYIRSNISARINVSRRDIERYYAEHFEDFNPAPKRDVVLIRVAAPAEADDVVDRLRAGEAFSAVAADPANILAAAPVMRGLEGDAPFGRPGVDDALAQLAVGEWAGPVAAGNQFWFVFLDDAVQPEAVSLLDAQTRIERALKEQQFIQLRKKFVDRLLREGSFTRPEQLTAALLDIAVNRYAGG